MGARGLWETCSGTDRTEQLKQKLHESAAGVCAGLSLYLAYSAYLAGIL